MSFFLLKVLSSKFTLCWRVDSTVSGVVIKLGQYCKLYTLTIFTALLLSSVSKNG